MFDLFISYSSHDRPWAARLYADLGKYYPEIKIFWDRDPVAALPVGVVWADELKKQARGAKHMVAAWTKKAEASKEVSGEIEAFLASVDLEPEKDGVKRKLFYIPLEGDYGAYLEQRQSLTEMRDLSTYDPNVPDRGTAKLETTPHREAWWRIVRIIIDAAQSAETTQPVNLAVLVTTTSNIDGLDTNRPGGPGPTASQYLVAASLTLGQAKARYGQTAFDWTPFGSGRTVIELMEELRLIVNGGLASPYRFHWVKYDLLSELVPFTNDYNGMCRWLERLAERPTIIIVDGLSLYNPVIKEWFQFLEDYAAKEHIVIVSLAPQEAPAAAQLYNALRFKGKPVLDSYFSPKIPAAGTFARCRVNVEHVSEIERLIRGSLGRYYLEQQKSASKPARGMGG
jgi:TIR domain-containing protein